MTSTRKTGTASLLAMMLVSGTAFAELQTETIEYKVDGKSFTGYMAYDDDFKDKRPGILVVHEWWGHNEFAREQAERLAKAGYTAFALDMYGSGKLAEHPEDAKKFMEAATSDQEAVAARFRAAKNLLADHQTVDASRMAAEGYCFGGAIVLNMARLGEDLAGVVSFHGSLGSPIQAEPGSIKARVQVYTGGADAFVPTEQVTGLVKEMQEAKADLMLMSFPGVTHSFTNPGADRIAKQFDMPIAYDETAAMRSRAGSLAFYQEIFAD